MQPERTAAGVEGRARGGGERDVARLRRAIYLYTCADPAGERPIRDGGIPMRLYEVARGVSDRAI
jgi:hypothetical protein